MGERPVEQIIAALGEQTVVVPGTAAAETILSRLAGTLRARCCCIKRADVAGELTRTLDPHPRAGVLTSMPGNGDTTRARILLDIGDADALPPRPPGRLRRA